MAFIPISTRHQVKFFPAVERAVGEARDRFVAEWRGEFGANEKIHPERIAEIEAEYRASAMENPGVCYLLKVPSIADRAEYEAEIEASPGRNVSLFEFRRVLREGVSEVVSVDQVEHCITVLDAYDAVIDAMVAGEPAPEDFGTLASDQMEIVEAVKANYQPYTRLVKLSALADRHGRIARIALFVTGCEGDGAPQVERRMGRLTDASLQAIVARGDVQALDARILSLMRPDQDAVGNSVSPAPSMPRDQAISTAAKTRRMARRGNSSGKRTSATRG